MKDFLLSNFENYTNFISIDQNHIFISLGHNLLILLILGSIAIGLLFLLHVLLYSDNCIANIFFWVLLIPIGAVALILIILAFISFLIIALSLVRGFMLILVLFMIWIFRLVLGS